MKISSDSNVRTPRPQGRIPRAALATLEASPDDRCDVDVVHLAAVQAARDALPCDADVVRLGALLSMLSNPTRLKMLLALRPLSRREAPTELCVCDLAFVAKVSQSLTSHQLRLLRTAGLVAARREGNLMFYHLTDGPATALLSDALGLTLRQETGSASPVRQRRVRKGAR